MGKIIRYPGIRTECLLNGGPTRVVISVEDDRSPRFFSNREGGYMEDRLPIPHGTWAREEYERLKTEKRVNAEGNNT